MLKIECIASYKKVVDCLGLRLKQFKLRPVYIEPLGRLELAIKASKLIHRRG